MSVRDWRGPHLIALALGARTASASAAAAQCAICGPRPPFAAAGPCGHYLKTVEVDDMPGPCAPDTPVCAGCAACAGGRPGDDPPPLRTRSLLVWECRALDYEPCEALQIEYLGRPEMRRVLAGCGDWPEDARYVVSWAVSGQKQHWRHAGISGRRRLVIGSDAGPIVYFPAIHRAALGCVELLLEGGFGREEIRAGSYSAPKIARFGAWRWQLAESALARLRDGGSSGGGARAAESLLDLLCWAARHPRDLAAGERIETDEEKGREDCMVEEYDRLAASLLADLARASALRARDGLRFWNEILLRRLRRCADLPLADAISRLARDLDVATIGAAGAVVAGAGFCDHDEAGVLRSLRSRPELVAALAYDMHRRRKDADEDRWRARAPRPGQDQERLI